MLGFWENLRGEGERKQRGSYKYREERVGSYVMMTRGD